MTRIAYLVHNLADSAVARRIVMFRAAGAEVTVLGFCREERAPAEIAGAPAVSLGRTHDADLGQRARQVFANVIRTKKLLEGCRDADVIVARNLETLVLGRWAQARLGGRRLVYESLDIHRSLLGGGVKGHVMRAIERSLMRHCSLLLSSSPAFLREYFEPVQKLAIPALLVENKLLALDGDPPTPALPVTGPPWRIGWFGNLRCRKTLATLLRLADEGGGRIEVLIAGKASPAEFPDFAAQVARPHVRYHGPYAPSELPGLYGQCHFAWSIDYFEQGLNSTWLLPNRVYEASCFGAVPVALANVETGRWLAVHDAGLLLEEGREAEQFAGVLRDITTAEYAPLRARVFAIPRRDLVADERDCAELLSAVAG